MIQEDPRVEVPRVRASLRSPQDPVETPDLGFRKRNVCLGKKGSSDLGCEEQGPLTLLPHFLSGQTPSSGPRGLEQL